jgi:hypothetical protein
MKKEKIFILLIILLIINLSWVLAAENVSVSQTSQRGYDCLKAKVENKCSSLTTEEKIFSLLASGQCKDELVSDSSDGECWPKSGCKIKTTAQAILALKENNANVEKAVNWILNKDAPAVQLQWFLQIESIRPVLCKVSYSGNNTFFFCRRNNKRKS